MLASISSVEVVVAVTSVPLSEAFKFHIASSLSRVAMDSIKNEASRVLNKKCKNLFRNRAKINLFNLIFGKYTFHVSASFYENRSKHKGFQARIPIYISRKLGLYLPTEEIEDPAMPLIAHVNVE